MNYVSNQNGKVLEGMLAGSNSDALKTTLTRCLRYFKMNLSLLQDLRISLHSSVTLSHTIESIANGSVG